MLFYVWLWAVYLLSSLTLASDANIKDNGDDTDAENVFADVIKNISRVNNVLQELISNYEHLQKLYKSQEALETEYESEISNEDNDQKTQKNNNQKDRSRVKVNTDQPISKFMAATQMILSERENDEVSDASSESSKANELTEENSPTVDTWHTAETYKPVREKKLPSIEKTTPKEKNKESKEEEEDSESDGTNSKQRSSKEEAKIIFVDTHKKHLKPYGHSEKPKILPASQYTDPVTTKIKTRYVVKEPSYPQRYSDNSIDPKSMLRTENNTNHKVKNVVYAEKFSNNIWADIIKNKPIQLEKEKVITYDENMNRLNNASEVSLRSNNVKSALVIVSENDKKPITKDSTSTLTEDDEAINKDMFKTNILRKAYGDACLKLVLRKCFKACKVVLKTVCGRYKCKKPLKEVFDENARTECIKYFSNAESNSKINTSTNDRYFQRGNRDISEEVTGFTDMTRGGYLAAACWSRAEHQQVSPAQPEKDAQFSLTPINEAKDLNILRDRYEKACRKISRERCGLACTSTYNNSCTGHDCSSKMKKYFRKTCKAQCKVAYSIDRSKSDSDSEDNSESSSSSSSEDSEDSEGSEDSEDSESDSD